MLSTEKIIEEIIYKLLTLKNDKRNIQFCFDLSGWWSWTFKSKQQESENNAIKTSNLGSCQLDLSNPQLQIKICTIHSIHSFSMENRNITFLQSILVAISFPFLHLMTKLNYHFNNITFNKLIHYTFTLYSLYRHPHASTR